MVAILVIMSTMVIVFKHCVDNLSSREKNSTSMNNDNINNSDSNTNSYLDVLKDYEFLNKPKSPEFQFPKLYNHTEKEPEHNSFTGLINPIYTPTNNLLTDFWNKKSEKPKSTIYDLRIDVEKILNDIETRNLNQERDNSYYLEEINKIKKRKSINPDYPMYPE